MNIVDRAKAILLSPKTEWPVIEGEHTTIADIYRSYLIYLAAIPAIAGFIGGSIIGYGGFGVHIRMGFFWGLTAAVIGFVVSLVMVFLMSLIVDALAPTFNGQKNRLSAFKLVAYAATAGMVAGIGSILPGLGALLGLLGGLYSIYLIYLGIPVLMKCPQEKALPYTVVVIVCGIIVGYILTALIPGPTGAMRMGSAGGGDNVSIKTPGGEVTLNSKKLEEASKRMEEASKKMEAASKSGDPAAVGKAAAEALAAMSGGQAREPIAAADLKPLLPEALAGLKRESWEAQSGGAMGFNGSTARATYRGDGDKSLRIEITDTGSLAGLVGLAGWMNVVGEKETPNAVEKVYKQGKRTIRERAEKDGDSEFTVVLENGVIVEGKGDNVDLSSVRKAVENLDLGKLETMKGKAS